MKFKFPATKPKREKLYVVTAGGKIVYVGRTNRPMATRIRVGLRPRSGKREYGYKWRKLTCPLVLSVWMTGRSRETTEAIEAELVFCVRHSTGRWPSRQTEIHFRDDVPVARKLAERLYGELKQKRSPQGGRQSGDAIAGGARSSAGFRRRGAENKKGAVSYGPRHTTRR